ncbi:MAG: HAD hydrolase family protein [Aigarchaeota archaeon]|nr:HAD hydrolase family protein [Aigarchaeota archaeon]MDW8093266.1 HAD hydrolase family protein [Nitrososphaerota archaeon]
MIDSRSIIAIDYDGTFTSAHPPSPEFLRRFRSHRKRHDSLFVLSSGRLLSDLMGVKEIPYLFDVIIAENGAILYFPNHGTKVKLFERPRGLEELVRGLSIDALYGEVLIATDRVNSDLLERHLSGLADEVEVKFNVGSMMIVPRGCDKGSSLLQAIAISGLRDPRRVVAVGDGENDEDLFRVADVRVAVKNAVPSLKERADLVLDRENGEGLLDFLERWGSLI